MERPEKIPYTEEMIEFLDQFQPTNIERQPQKIEESLKVLEKKVASINQKLQEKKKRVTLTRVNEKLDQIFNLVLLMNAKFDQHNALLHQIRTQSQAADI